ncbi:MAG: TIGR03364 family FAD-dependent oxidoreductase [Cyclobacteriaceae bacterium]|jgi:FAD dependent oxidoreductase TIGR03364|nr:TIGR03364 family FAD-dependent oxidoreductase [Cyclobacteriaceae bacterium]
MKHRYDLIVIGAGILGTMHAYHAAARGMRVLLVEKDQYPTQATVRNFGQVVPSGMSSSWFDYGVTSTQLYKTIQKEYDIGIRQHGSVYIASDEDEQKLIHELKQVMDARGYEAHLLTKSDCIKKWPALQNEYSKEAIFFPQEVSAEPSFTIHALIKYCTLKFPNLIYIPATTIIDCIISKGHVNVISQLREVFFTEKVIVCNGSEFKILFPDQFRNSGIEVSKLQMMATYPMKEVALEGNILTGLTIRRYESFEELPSFSSIRTPAHLTELKKWGIHILFKKGIDGSIIIGDSHEYASVNKYDDLGFDTKESINKLMLNEAQRIVKFNVSNIARTWAGFYSQHPEKDIVEIDIDNNIHIRTAIGGKGMTSSAGYAAESIQRIFS